MKVCRLPSHASCKLWFCGVAALALLKIAYREEVEGLERGGIKTIVKSASRSYTVAQGVKLSR